MNLYCMTCHTRWVEQVLCAGDQCPFRDCDGVLSAARPTPPVKRREPPPRAGPLPLLALIERLKDS